MATRRLFKSVLLSCSAAFALSAALSTAHAADLAPTPVAPVAPALPTFSLFDGIEYHAQFEGGILGNASNSANGQNIGHLYTDRSNTPQINQALLTVAKNIDPKATGYAFGFTAQALFGSDERYNHFLGFADSNITGRNQFGLVQGYGAAHLPWFTEGGVDLKVGLYSSPQGYETLDPSTNPFYSHSYTYNYAVTFNHTGILSTTHVNNTLDIWLGVDTGNQTTFGGGDPNRQIAGFVGFGLNHLFEDKLTVLALSHIGPEQSLLVDPNAKSDLRYYNDVVLTYKINDDWTSVTELNYTKDEFGNAPGGFSTTGIPLPTGSASYYAIAQYFGYALNKEVTLNARGEVARDDKGFFVANFPDNLGLVRGEKGLPVANPTLLPGPTTYGAITLGLTYKPSNLPKGFALVMVRPEIRYDRALSNNSPFIVNSNTGAAHKDQFTFGGDVTIGF
ncbi:outer membrane beta-barrel protein [Beijerinckia sp. L45]|uniref:outer membrane beta-barrel protein n=1 Tax=Beijerinckia sp. L45 TaxID=1641855 RepID=UPI00131B23C6|nr:outer membrane beta-barrel protein [Beijerinckia sp. L45]